MRTIVYTVNTGGYDQVRPPRFQEPGVRYLLYTDGPPVAGWERIEWPSGAMESRRPKIAYHKVLPPHDWSIYHDGCIQLTCPPSELVQMCSRYGVEFGACLHPKAVDCYEHARQLAMLRRFAPDAAKYRAQASRYREEGVPDGYGMAEGTFLVRHNGRKAGRLSEAWWQEYQAAESQRDQLALYAASHKCHYWPQVLPFPSRDNGWYTGWGQHQAAQGTPRRKVRFLMATVVSGDTYEAIYDVVRPLHEAYAAKWGYDYRVIRAPESGDYWPSPSWWKMELMRDMGDYDGVFFVDCDAWVWPDAPPIHMHVPMGKFGAINSFQLPYMASPTGTTMRSWRTWCGRAKVRDMEPASFGWYVNAGVWFCWRGAKEALTCGNPVETDQFLEQHQVNWNLYQRPALYHELPRAWNYGHVFRDATYDAAHQAHVVHLNGTAVSARAEQARRIIETRPQKAVAPKKAIAAPAEKRVYFGAHRAIIPEVIEYAADYCKVRVVATDKAHGVDWSDIGDMSFFERARTVKQRLETIA